MKITAVFNRDGGTFKTTDMELFSRRAHDIFAAEGHEFDAHIIDSNDVMAELEKVASTEPDHVLMAGGGDGTISAAAGIAWKNHVPLAVIPAGTMNLFARTLKIPQVLDQALQSLATGEIRQVDIATANGQPFVHQFSIGFQARMVRLRNEFDYGSRLGKIIASVRAFAKVALNPPRFRVQITIDGQTETRKVSAIAISNNPYGKGILPFAADADTGQLGVYIARRLTPRSFLRLAIGALRGQWNGIDLDEKLATEVHLHFPHLRSSARAVVDGELIPLEKDVTIKLYAGELQVLVPAPVAA